MYPDLICKVLHISFIPHNNIHSIHYTKRQISIFWNKIILFYFYNKIFLYKKLEYPLDVIKMFCYNFYSMTGFGFFCSHAYFIVLVEHRRSTVLWSLYEKSTNDGC